MLSLKRALVVALSAGTLVLVTSAAGTTAATRHCTKRFTLAEFHRAAVNTYHGARLPPRGSYGHLWLLVRCQRAGPGARAEARRIWWAAHDAWRARRHPQPDYSAGGLGNVPGVPYSFASCVAFRESTDGRLSSNIYGIIPASGYNVAGMSVAQQKQVFSELYAKDGTAPWSRYDGC